MKIKAIQLFRIGFTLGMILFRPDRIPLKRLIQLLKDWYFESYMNLWINPETKFTWFDEILTPSSNGSTTQN